MLQMGFAANWQFSIASSLTCPVIQPVTMEMSSASQRLMLLCIHTAARSSRGKHGSHCRTSPSTRAVKAQRPGMRRSCLRANNVLCFKTVGCREVASQVKRRLTENMRSVAFTQGKKKKSQKQHIKGNCHFRQVKSIEWDHTSVLQAKSHHNLHEPVAHEEHDMWGNNYQISSKTYDNKLQFFCLKTRKKNYFKYFSCFCNWLHFNDKLFRHVSIKTAEFMKCIHHYGYITPISHT